MTSILHTSRRPQAATTSTPLTKTQVKNNSSAYVYAVADGDRFKRFLIIGTDGGTFYQSEKELTDQTVEFVKGYVAHDQFSASQAIVWAAKNAPKRTYALYSLAVLASQPVTGAAAASRIIGNVIGNGTDLLEFVAFVDGMRGWGRGLKSLVADFLTSVDEDKLALWGVKYRNRHGWTWADVLRKSHAKTAFPTRNAVFGFLADKPFNVQHVPDVVLGYELAKSGDLTASQLAEAIRTMGLPWEALTDEQRTDAVWNQLVTEGNLGNVALLRNLVQLTRRNVIKPLSAATVAATNQLTQAKNLHPLKILEASKVYRGQRIGYQYGRTPAAPHKPVPMIESALETALENAFTRGVKSTGKAIYYAVDVSGSMGSPYSGSEVVSCCEAAAALALGSVKKETNVVVKGFTRGADGSSGRYMSHRGQNGLVDLGFTPTTTFKEAVKMAQKSNFGATDASLPFKDALANGYVVDAFVVITDNETNGGTTHVAMALAEYRRKVNPRAKLIVIGMTATPFTVADPADPLCLNMAGFSADTPAVISAFLEL